RSRPAASRGTRASWRRGRWSRPWATTSRSGSGRSRGSSGRPDVRERGQTIEGPFRPDVRGRSQTGEEFFGGPIPQEPVLDREDEYAVAERTPGEDAEPSPEQKGPTRHVSPRLDQELSSARLHQ